MAQVGISWHKLAKVGISWHKRFLSVRTATDTDPGAIGDFTGVFAEFRGDWEWSVQTFMWRFAWVDLQLERL